MLFRSVLGAVSLALLAATSQVGAQRRKGAHRRAGKRRDP